MTYTRNRTPWAGWINLAIMAVAGFNLGMAVMNLAHTIDKADDLPAATSTVDAGGDQ